MVARVTQYPAFLPEGGNLNQRYNNGDFKVWYKYGRNPVVSTTPEDIWNYGGFETLPTTAVTMWIACTDNVAGVGQIFAVEGMDENWAYKTEFVTLAGQTPVIIGAASSWTRINRAYQVSALPDPVGNVYIAEDDTDFALGIPQTASNVHALVDFVNPFRQTEKAMLTVPAGHEALIYGFHGSMSETTSGATRHGDIFIEAQEMALGATVASPSWAPFLRIEQHAMRSDGNSSTGERYTFPLGPFPELTNIHMRAECSAASAILADVDIVTYKV